MKSKKLLTSDKFLVHFDSACDLSLACDASTYGLRVVLSHKMSNGSDKPIGYASWTLVLWNAIRERMLSLCVRSEEISQLLVWSIF